MFAAHLEIKDSYSVMSQCKTVCSSALDGSHGKNELSFILCGSLPQWRFLRLVFFILFVGSNVSSQLC